MLRGGERAARLTVWATFGALVVGLCWNVPAWDLTATYVAGRLIASGQAGALYDQTRGNAAARPHSAWALAAGSGGIEGWVVTPYIQTPLWAWMAAWPAAHLQFKWFKRIFAGLSAASVACMLYVSARQWSPGLTGWRWQAGLLAGLFCTVPFDAGLLLGQTHLLFMCVAVCAAVAALSRRPILAGCLLAVACAVKITPGWVALTWLVAGRSKAAASFALASALLVCLAIAVGGPALFQEYVRILGHMNRFALLSYNNDSIVTVLMSRALTPDTAFRFRMVALPVWIATVSVMATVCCAIYGGLLDRRAKTLGTGQFGAVLTLVAATAFSPLAWNHYFVVLVLPVMLMLEAVRQGRSAAWLATIAGVVLLLVPPLAATPHSGLATVAWRSEFWAAILCLGSWPFIQLKPAPVLGRSGCYGAAQGHVPREQVGS